MMQTDTTLTRAALVARYGPTCNPDLVQVDKTQRPSTLGIWDHTTPWGAPGGYMPLSPVPAGTTTRNSVETGSPGMIPVELPYSDRTLAFTVGGPNNKQVQYGTTPLKTGLALSCWVKSVGAQADGGNVRLMVIEGLFEIYLTADANRKITAVQIVGPGVTEGFNIGIADLNAALNDGLWHKIRVHMEAAGSGKHRYRVSIDAIEVAVSPDYTTGSLSGSGLVAFGAAYAPFTLEARLARVRLEDIPPGAAQALDDLEYDAWAGRIGGL